MFYLDNHLNLKQFFKTWLKKLKYHFDGFSYDGIHIFTGPQGSGKTLKLMHVVDTMIKEYPEALIVSNIQLYGIDFIPYTGIECFEKINNGKNGIIFIIDEIQTLFSSLESKDMPVSTLTVWSQNRKNRRVILGTSQRYNRVAKGLREQTKYHIECHEGLGGFFKYRIIDASEYDEQGKLPLDYKMPRWAWYVPRPDVMDSYDTYEVVKR